MNFNVEDSSGLGGKAAVIYTGTEFWSAVWNSDQISSFDATGNFINNFSIAGLSNTRSMVLNGSTVYAVNNSDTIFVIDVITKTLSSSFVVANTIRHIAFDPTANSGAGGVWAGSWGADFVLYDLNGNILNTITTATHGFSSVYSTAIDTFTVGGPYLWVFHQGGSSSQAEIDRLEIATGNRTNINFDVANDLGYPTALAGGLFITDALISGQLTIGGCLQTTPDNVFAYELNDLILPDYDTETDYLQLNDGLTQIPLNHAGIKLDFNSNVKNIGGMTLDSVKVSIDVLNALNVSVYQEEKVFYNLVLGGSLDVLFNSMTPEIGIFTVNVDSEPLGNVDANLSNNSISFNFEITEDRLSRDDGVYINGGYSLSGDDFGFIAVKFDVETEDSLGLIHVNFTNPNIGDSTYGIIYQSQNGEPANFIARTPAYIINDAQLNMWFEDTIILLPGSYFFGVYESAFTSINLAQSLSIFKQGVNYFMLDGGNWNASGIETARAIHPRFNWNEVNCETFSVDLVSTNTNINLGDMVTLSVTATHSNTSNIVWKLNNNVISGATNFTYDYTANAIGNQSFKIEVETEDACQATKFLTITVSDTSSISAIEKIDELSYISVFPNPVNEKLNIEISTFKDIFYEGVILNLTGKEMQEFPLNNNGITSINVSEINKGIYFLKLKGIKKIVYKEFVIE